MASLKNGDRGVAVTQLQDALNLAGAAPQLEVDGIFGPLTKTAVVAFQRGHGLKADGIAGEATIAALISAGALGDKSGSVAVSTPASTPAPAGLSTRAKVGIGLGIAAAVAILFG